MKYLGSLVVATGLLIFGAPLQAQIILPSSEPALDTPDRMLKSSLFLLSSKQSEWFSKFEMTFLHTAKTHSLIFLSKEDFCQNLRPSQGIKNLNGYYKIAQISVHIIKESSEEKFYKVQHEVCENPKPVAVEEWLSFGMDLEPIDWASHLMESPSKPFDLTKGEFYKQIRLVLPRAQSVDYQLSTSTKKTDLGGRVFSTFEGFQRLILGQTFDPKKNEVRFEFLSPQFNFFKKASSICQNTYVAARWTHRGRELAIGNPRFSKGIDIRQFKDCMDNEVVAINRSVNAILESRINRLFPIFDVAVKGLGNQELIKDLKRMIRLLDAGEAAELRKRLEALLEDSEEDRIKDQRDPT